MKVESILLRYIGGDGDEPYIFQGHMGNLKKKGNACNFTTRLSPHVHSTR